MSEVERVSKLGNDPVKRRLHWRHRIETRDGKTYETWSCRPGRDRIVVRVGAAGIAVMVYRAGGLVHVAMRVAAWSMASFIGGREAGRIAVDLLLPEPSLMPVALLRCHCVGVETATTVLARFHVIWGSKEWGELGHELARVMFATHRRMARL